MAKESAASRAAKIERQHLASRAATGQCFFKLLGVSVRGGKVYKGSGLLGNELGDLAGACADVLETRRVGPVARLISGVPPLLGKALRELPSVRPPHVGPEIRTHYRHNATGPAHCLGYANPSVLRQWAERSP